MTEMLSDVCEEGGKSAGSDMLEKRWLCNEMGE
jgi:hypothetical protein